MSHPHRVISATAALWLAAVALGCGARGEPLPPLRPIPPAIPELRVGQIGIEATLSFVAPPARFILGSAEVEVESIELLLLTERYPAISPEMLALALDRERMTRLRDAREAVGRVRDDRRRRRLEERLRVATERALAAGDPPPTLESLGLLPEPEKEEEEEEEEPRPVPTEDELLLRKVPRNVLEAWRQAELQPDVVLAAARRLNDAVDLLWDELGLPTAIVDLSEPPAMPEPVELVAGAARIARSLVYEESVDVIDFIENATTVTTVPHRELATEIVDGRVVLRHVVGIPSPGPIRTRYHFAVRIASDGKSEGAIDVVAVLAPLAVPVAPAEVVGTVSPSGVTLEWLPPGGDLWGESLTPDQLRYNVYRRRTGDESRFPTEPLNDEPLETTTFTDTEMGWGGSYVYLVRALNGPAITEQTEPSTEPATTQDDAAVPPSPRKEGIGAESPEVEVVDTFPPEAISGLEATRVADRVTLRWTTPRARTVAGFRVYRHQAPVASILDPDPSASPTEPTDTPDDATAAGAAEAATVAAELTPQEIDPDAELCPPLPDLSVVGASEAPALAPDSTADGEDKSESVGDAEDQGESEGDAEDEGEGRRQIGGRRHQLRSLTGAGWDLLTPTLITAQLYIDPVAKHSVSWLYLVSAVDEAGNEGPLACVGVHAESER